jgi:hypothetical protein
MKLIVKYFFLETGFIFGGHIGLVILHLGKYSILPLIDNASPPPFEPSAEINLKFWYGLGGTSFLKILL